MGKINILWDFDGTLFNTYPAYTKAMKQVLKDTVTEDEIYKQLKISFGHAMKFFQLSDQQIEDFISKEKKIEPKDTLPFEGLESVLKQSNRNVIMTHKRRSAVENTLDFYQWKDYFVEIVAGDDGFPRKPDTTSYQYLHDKYNLDLAVGDRELDIIPALELGFRTCLFQNKMSTKADFYLDDYRDFKEKVLNRW